MYKLEHEAKNARQGGSVCVYPAVTNGRRSEGFKENQWKKEWKGMYPWFEFLYRLFLLITDKFLSMMHCLVLTSADSILLAQDLDWDQRDAVTMRDLRIGVGSCTGTLKYRDDSGDTLQYCPILRTMTPCALSAPSTFDYLGTSLVFINGLDFCSEQEQNKHNLCPKV